MICFGAIVFLYLFIGWVVSYEAHKRDWNSQLPHYDQAGHLVWWLFWWWPGWILLNQKSEVLLQRGSPWIQDGLERLFERMMNFEWRKDDEADS